MGMMVLAEAAALACRGLAYLRGLVGRTRFVTDTSRPSATSFPARIQVNRDRALSSCSHQVDCLFP